LQKNGLKKQGLKIHSSPLLFNSWVYSY